MIMDRAATKRSRKRERAKPRQQIDGDNNIQAGRDLHITIHVHITVQAATRSGADETAASAAKRAR